MNTRIFEAFKTREREVNDVMAGCGTRHGMDCSCGTNCKCKSGACACGNKFKSSQSMVQPNQISSQILSQRQFVGTNTNNTSLQGIDSFRTPAFFHNNINAVPGNVPSLNDASTTSLLNQNQHQHQQGSFLSQEQLQFLLHQQQQHTFSGGLNGINMNCNELNPMILMQQAQMQQQQQQQQQQQSQMQQEIHGDNSAFFPNGRSPNDVGIGMNGLIGQNANIAMMAQTRGSFTLNGTVPPDFNHNNMVGFVNAGRMHQMEQWNSNVHNGSMEEFVETDS